jgi:hypothetical protein
MRLTTVEICKRKAQWLLDFAFLMVLTLIQIQRGLGQEAVREQRTRNVIVVMLDGMRWEEVFRGADPKLINKRSPKLLGHSAERTSLAKELYWRDTAAERRQALMPFMWSVVATQGQIFGNRDLGSDSHVTNRQKFSYPGYNETLTGSPDNRRITSNHNIPNPNVTVMEWLDKRPAFKGRVAAFGAWQVFKGIFNSERCGFVVNTAYEPLVDVPPTPELALLNTLKDKTPRVWRDESFDLLPFYTAVEYLKVKKPRVMFIGLGETDDWAHMGAYPEYLNAAHRDDEYLRELWTLVQSMPEYRDQTTLIVLPDHGRGTGPLWVIHAWPVPGSGQTWMAFLGPDTPALGERQYAGTVRESQVAATVAALMGEDYKAAVPEAGIPIMDVLGSQVQTVTNAISSELPQQGSQQAGSVDRW